jgi:hypothetical protein
MVVVSMFAIALISEKEAPRLERGLLGLALLPMTYAVVLSGSRSPLIMLGVGLLIIAWYRREVLSFVVIPGALYAAFKWAASFTKGAATERFSTLLQQTTIWDRFYIPMLFTWYVFLQNPWGGGLGKSGYSLPFVFRDQAGYDDFKMGEGDLSCLAIEMGVVGLGVFLWLLYEASRLILESLSRLRGTPAFTLALASATAMSTAVICFPIGSPFLGIPTGALTWFFLGTLHKVSLQYQTTAKPCAPAVPRPRPVAQVRHAAAPEPPRARPPRRPKLLP